jgi:hypothetical protein
VARHLALLLLLFHILPAGALAQQRTVVVTPGFSTQILIDTLGTPDTLAAPRRDVFLAVAAVYQALKVPVELVDTTNYRIGNPGFRRTGTFGGKRLSTWLSCGDGITGPNADSYRVTLSLHTLVQPGPEGRSLLRTAVLAGALNVGEGAGRQPLPCTSTGGLERRIRQMVEEELARRP